MSREKGSEYAEVPLRSLQKVRTKLARLPIWKLLDQVSRWKLGNYSSRESSNSTGLEYYSLSNEQ